MTLRRRLPAVIFAAGLAGACGVGTALAQVPNPMSAPPADEGEPQAGGNVTYALNVDTATLDPAACGHRGWDRCWPVFGNLLRWDAESDEIVPAMAESFETVDELHWTLKLHEGITFTDGTPYDADAIVFNWDRIADPENLSPSASTIANMTYEATDPLTVEITLEEPDFTLPSSLAHGLGMIGSPTAIEALGEDFGNAPVGAGPFIIDEWVRNSSITYTANPDYFEEGLPYLDTLEVVVIPQDDQRLNALRTGEIDANWSTNTEHAATMESEGFTVNRTSPLGGTGVAFNYEDPDLQDEGLRQALLMTLSGQQLNDLVYNGDPEATAFFPPDSRYRDDSLGVYPTQDLEEAQSLFDDYLERSGKSEVELEFTYYGGLPFFERLVQVVQSQMQELDGVTITLKPVDGATIQSAGRSGDFQLLQYGVPSTYVERFYEVFHSEGSLNYMNYSNPTVDEALETTRTSGDAEEIEEAWKVIGGEVSKDAPLWLWRYYPGLFMTRPEMHGFVSAPSPSGIAAYFEYAWVDG